MEPFKSPFITSSSYRKPGSGRAAPQPKVPFSFRESGEKIEKVQVWGAQETGEGGIPPLWGRITPEDTHSGWKDALVTHFKSSGAQEPGLRRVLGPILGRGWPCFRPLAAAPGLPT